MIEQMMMNKRFLFLPSMIGAIALLIGFLIPLGDSCASSKTPLVAMETVVSEPSSINYVGKALSKMLLTRLSSEGIDTVLVEGSTRSGLKSVADFVITGKVVKAMNHYEASFELRSPRDGTVIKRWDLKAPTLDMLAKDAALLSAKISDTVKDTGQVLVANTVSDFSALSVPDSKKVKTDDEFALARLHPDILVREKLEKDELEEIEQQRRRSGTSSTVRKEGEVENDSFMPLPDVYDVGDDAPEDQNLENDSGSPKTASVSSEDEDDSSFMPIPDVYDPDDDEDAIEKPKTEEASSGVQKHEGHGSKGAEADKPNKEGKGNWYSWLWPFGNDKQNKGGAQLVSQAKETRLQKQESDKEPVVISSSQKLPVPPPPRVSFEIPEPVPLDEALSKIENIKVEKKKEKGWFSWLWPWTEEEPEVVQQQSFVSRDGSNGHAVAKQDGGLQTLDAGSQPDTIRNRTGMETDQPDSATQIQSTSTPDMNSREQQEGVSVPDSAQTKRPERVDRPIWQWN